jgi:hypothetical protein
VEKPKCKKERVERVQRGICKKERVERVRGIFFIFFQQILDFFFSFPKISYMDLKGVKPSLPSHPLRGFKGNFTTGRSPVYLAYCDRKW